MDRFSEYRIMWILVLFDLPTETKKDKKAYIDFRKNLQKDGLTNWQNCIIRMVIQRNAWISVMRWFSGSVKANMS